MQTGLTCSDLPIPLGPCHAANYGSPSLHNWVVGAGARLVPRGPLGPTEDVKAPTGIQYIDFLRMQMCTFGPIEQGIKFRQVRPAVLPAAGPKGGERGVPTLVKGVFLLPLRNETLWS